jgi:hypothetical protein
MSWKRRRPFQTKISEIVRLAVFLSNMQHKEVLSWAIMSFRKPHNMINFKENNSFPENF